MVEKKILGRASLPYKRRTWRGKPFDNRTVSALQWAERHYIDVAPKKRKPWVIYQGSYSTGASQNSKGTHDGGGAVDISTEGMNDKQKRAVVKWLRKGGWAAWLRPYIKDVWPEHIHAELLWHKTASEGAKQQWDAYLNHRDGLSGNRPDNSWRPKVQWRWSHRQNRRVRK